MRSAVLRSEKATAVSIEIMDVIFYMLSSAGITVLDIVNFNV